MRHRKAANFYGSFVSHGELCFDIGANIGDRTAIFRAIGARTVAVEPQAACAKELLDRFAADPDVTLVTAAVGSQPGSAEIAICLEDSTISTMSSHWQTDGRFADREWAESEVVPVTTLDRLVDEHGVPTFCKIDVEGYERQALEGLSSPLPCVSLEFTREFQYDAEACVGLLGDLGPVEASLSVGESMRLAANWGPPHRVFELIEELPPTADWGDIYVRSAAPPSSA